MPSSKVLKAFGILLACGIATGPAGAAPTAELAKKCREMMIKAYPKGPAQQQRDYFKTCLERNGKMDQ